MTRQEAAEEMRSRIRVARAYNHQVGIESLGMAIEALEKVERLETERAKAVEIVGKLREALESARKVLRASHGKTHYIFDEIESALADCPVKAAEEVL